MMRTIMSYHESNGPQGILTFRSLADALRAGYEIFDKIEDGYLVRTRTDRGWALAVACVTCN